MIYLKLFENFNELYKQLDGDDDVAYFADTRDFDTFSDKEVINIKNLFIGNILFSHRRGYVFYPGIVDQLTDPIDYIDMIIPGGVSVLIWKFEDDYYILSIGVKNDTYGAYAYNLCDTYEGLKRCILDRLKNTKDPNED
jgi:hypothetical protein